ncbi:MAG: glycosyltransferase family 4 protein [Gemmatimonadota bacterium]|nr:glycosyltransferase family 4 protein [Gemmatimonadota bacterium]
MRIAFVTATPQTVQSGSGTYVASSGLARALETLGVHVRLIHPPKPTGLLGFTVNRLRFNRRLRADTFGRDDVVVGWDMDGYRLSGNLRVPFVAYVNGVLADEARFERGFVGASMRLQAQAERRSVRSANRVLTLSRYSRQRLADLYDIPRASIGVVPPAFDTDRWQATRASVEPPPSRRPLVLSVARLYPRKDLSTLVRAALPLRERIPEVQVRIVGDGPERRSLAGLVHSLGLEQTIDMTGQLDFVDLVASYATCDVFCLPSRQEGFGLVFLEAMASGKPVVACRETAAEELVEDGSNGLLVPPRDPGALASALDRLLGDAELRAHLGAAGPPRADQYSPERVARRFLSEIETVAP